MAAALSVDPLLLQKDAGVAAAVKKLLHLRAAFEAPLLDVFGFPFILRHQLAAAACCACCSSCCCCVRAALPQFHSQKTPCRPEVAAECAVAADAAVAGSRNVPSSVVAVTGACGGVGEYHDPADPFTSAAAACSDAAAKDSHASLPCSPSRCSCCRGSVNFGETVSVRCLAQPQGAVLSNSSSRGSSTTSGGGTDSRGSRAAEAACAVRRNRKRLRLVGEDPVAAVVAAAVGRHRSSGYARTQDERAVEILISCNVLRQIKLPIDAGSYVLFFTADWLQCLQRSICAAQREALLLLKQQQCCARCRGAYAELERIWRSSSSSVNSSCSKESDSGSSRGSSRGSGTSWRTRVTDTSSFDGHPPAAADGYDTFSSSLAVSEDASSSGSAAWCSLHSSTAGTECSMCPSRCAAATQAGTAAPLRFTPVLEQDEVQTDSQPEQGSDAGGASRSRKRVLLHLPVMLGQQLKDVLLLQLLNVHTQTHIDKRSLEEVLRSYLQAWRRRRYDAVLYLKEVLRSAEDLLREVTREESVGFAEGEHESEIRNQEAASSEEEENTDARASHAAVKSVAGRHKEEHPNNGLVKEEAERSLQARKKEVERSCRIREVRRAKQCRDSYTTESTENPACTDAAPGTRRRECSRDDVSLQPETGKAGVATASPTYSRIHTEEQTKTTLNEDDAKRPLGTGEESSTFSAKRSTALVKQLAYVQELLQCGCKAAAEVFSLQESVAARAALKWEENTRGRWGTAEAETDKGEAGGGEEESAEGWETQEQEDIGRKVMRIKKEKEEEAEVGEKSKGLTKGLTAPSRTVELDSESRSGRFCEGPWRRHRSSAHAAAVCLKENVRYASAVLQLLTKSAKTVPHQHESYTVHVESLTARGESSGTSGALPCRTTNTAPAVLRATGGCPTCALHCVTSDRGGGETANMLQQQSAARSAAIPWQGQALNARTKDEANKRSGEEAQQRQDISEPALQRDIDGILLLLYDAPLLYSRAGSNAVSLAVPQQGLLVRWLRDGRKEVLHSIRRRRYKEVLWVDIERRGLLKSGLGSRMALLDLKGIGEVETTETAAGVVVRLVEEVSQQA